MTILMMMMMTILMMIDVPCYRSSPFPSQAHPAAPPLLDQKWPRRKQRPTAPSRAITRRWPQRTKQPFSTPIQSTR